MKNNPVIRKLIKEMPNIKYSKHSLKQDISLLINAFNLVCSISSFLNTLIQLNYNLKFLWEYNIYKMNLKIRQYHYSLYKFPYNNFTIFKMEPSPDYENKMYSWQKKRNQINLMLKDKCINNFRLSLNYVN